VDKGRFASVVLLGLVVLFGNHVLYQNLEGARLDLTADDLYSLTEGSREILERMQSEGVKPIEIELYFSETVGKTLPKFIKNFIVYESYLRSLLREYERASAGKIRLRFVDPLPDSDEAEDALAFGLDGKPVNQEGDPFFFGLVLQTRTGSREVIDFLWPDRQESIEYEISKRIYSLLWPSGKTIGVLSSLEVFGSADNPYLAQMLAAQGRPPREKWIALQLLEESYGVRRLDPEMDHISPDEYDLVLAVHPKSLSEKSLWALDEWVVRGGNLLVFLDPYALEDRPPQNPQQPWQALQYQPSSGLEPLLSAWGLEMPENRFAADFDLAVRRPLMQRGPAESLVVDLLIDERKREETLATSHPLFQGLAELRLLLAGSLKKSESATAELTPLISTTAGGNVLTIEPGFGGGAELAYTDLNQPARLRDRLAPGSEPVVIAYQISGRLGSAFPEGADFPATTPETPPGLPPGLQLPPPEDSEMVRKEPVPEEERGESSVLVFADVDLISDQVAFERNILGLVLTANDNHKLLLNAVDYLLGAESLMSVRAKRSIRRPFTLFDDIEAASEKETLERERDLRGEIEAAEEQLREKQSEISGRNAALFQKRIQDEVDRLNEKVRSANRELREIRQARRQALAREESKVRLAVLGWMPTVVFVAGIALAVRRRVRHGQARRS
jgi:ABC-type uncharacterized transport system involved in gliding motility auxiliary subunit